MALLSDGGAACPTGSEVARLSGCVAAAAAIWQVTAATVLDEARVANLVAGCGMACLSDMEADPPFLLFRSLEMVFLKHGIAGFLS